MPAHSSAPRRPRGTRASLRTLGALVAATAVAAGALLTATPALAAPSTVNPLAGASGFTVVSLGDAELSNHEIEGSVAAAGAVSSKSPYGPYNLIHAAAGSSAYTLPQHSNGEYVRLVAGSYDRAGSTQLIRVSSGGNPGTAATQGLVMVGDTTGLNVASRGNGVCVQAAGATDCSGAVIEQSNFSQTPASVTQPGAFSDFVSAADVTALTSAAKGIADGALVGTVATPALSGSGMERELTLTAGRVNVWTVDAATLPSGDWKLRFDAAKPSATTTLVIRLLVADGATANLPMETIGAYDAPGGQTDNNFARYMLWNVEQPAGSTATLTGNGIIPGSFLAPQSTLITAPGAKTLIEGQIVAGTLALRNSGEVHHYGFAATLDIDAGTAPATGGFSIRKALSGPAGLVPSTTMFTIAYRVDGGAEQTLTVPADGSTRTVTGLPDGSVVTFTEPGYPAVPGVTWTGHTFSTSSLTIDATAPSAQAVTVTNSYTATASTAIALWSQAYVGAVANGVVTPSSREVRDRVFYANLEPGTAYRLAGELVYLDGGAIVSTGITNSVPFTTPTSTDPTVSSSLDSTFEIPANRLAELNGRRVFIFQTLFDAADIRRAADNGSTATDPWFATTAEWFTVAVGGGSGGGGTSTDPSAGGAPRLPDTGAGGIAALGTASIALLLSGAALAGFALAKRRMGGGTPARHRASGSARP
ncbi:MAG: hypothetical protein DI534_05100 [Leifsonia xyli]|nr:MAG: hypothetical protein DI534_05100 [Leifsonia xyli]